MLFLLQELPKDKWFCCDDCNRIYVALQNSVSAGADTIPSSLSELIIRKHEDRGLCTYGDMNDIQWRILSGKSRYAEHLPLLSRAAAIFRVSVYGFCVTPDLEFLLYMWLIFWIFLSKKLWFSWFFLTRYSLSLIIKPTFEISFSLDIRFFTKFHTLIFSLQKRPYLI